MERAEKTKEQRLRRQLDRMGYQLMKNRSRTPEAYNYQGYMVVNPVTGFVVAGAHINSFDLDLDGVEGFIRETGRA